MSGPHGWIGHRTAWVVALFVPAAAAALMIPWRRSTQSSNLALVMVVVVAVAVVPGYRLAGMVAGLSAGVWFDFFLTRPYEHLSIQRSADIQTTVLLAAVAVTIGEIAARRRAARHDSHVAKGEVVSIYVVAQMLSAGARSTEVISVVTEQLEELLYLESCRFEPHPAPPHNVRLNRAGEIEYGRHDWPLQREGLAQHDVNLSVETNGRDVGHFVLRGPTINEPLPHDRLLVAVALADLVGASLLAEKSIFLG
jgi:K+-sensing histidine kinase KdpD